MESPSGTSVVPSTIDRRWNEVQRSMSKVWSCPKCHNQSFHREDKLFNHVSQSHPEFSEGSREDDMAAFRAWLRRETQLDKQ